MKLCVTFIALNVGHCPLVTPKGEVTYEGSPPGRIRILMSLAQLILCRSAKMRETLEGTTNLFYNLYKNPTSLTVAGFATKTIMSPNLKS